jgi:hypothetical protein
MRWSPRRGWRAEKRKPLVSAILADHGWRLSARHIHKGGCFFAAIFPLHTGPRFRLERLKIG